MGFLRTICAVSGLAVLSACTVEDPADQIARQAAKDAVRPILAKRLPGVPIEPAVECVIDNASAKEILTLAKAGVTGQADAETTQTVVIIIKRPETIECIAKDGLAPFLR